MTKRFSPRFKTFKDWLSYSPRTSSYAKRIIRLYSLYKRASLGELGKMSVKAEDLSRKAWTDLNAAEKTTRISALDIVRKMRHGASLKDAMKEHQLTMKEILKHVGKALLKKGRRWIARKRDHIQREMQIYSRGSVTSIIVTNSRDASLIGKYFATVRVYLRTGNKEILKQFGGKFIEDAKGKKHFLETRGEKIREIEDAKEDDIVQDIYRDE